MFGVARRIRERSAWQRHRWAMGGVLVALLCGVSAQPASAQFRFFGESEASTQDVYDTIANNGFRMAGPLMRNGEVYVADVIDRRQRRERLIISRSNGQIVQRFFVDLNGRPGPYAAQPGYGYAAPPPQRAPVARNDDSDFFSRIVRGWGEDAPPRPPGDIENGAASGAVMPPSLPRPQRMTRPRPTDTEPRLAVRREEAPITSRPLPVPAPAPSPVTPPVEKVAPAAEKPPVTSAPPTASTPPTRATVVNTDPLRIPGQREPEAPKPTPAATVAAKQPAPVPAAVKPAPPKAAPVADVPVAPLD